MTLQNPITSGIDGVVPQYDPEGIWRNWGMQDIYLGQAAAKRFVPKVLDFVTDFNGETYTIFVVDHLDPVTLIPTLREIHQSGMSFTMTETDVLFGVGPGTQADTYRVYVDDSVMPHIMAVDIRLKVAGSMSSYCKIFKGSDVSKTGVVISKMYDGTGNYISDAVPLELVAIDSHINYSIKTVQICHTTHGLVDGEIVTVVVYSDSGHVVSKRQLLVENTAFIRSLNVSQRYVTHISLRTPFLSSTNDHVIDYPLNVPINALNVIGVVHYSDGHEMELPANGGKFSLYGIDQYLSTIVGQEVDLVLSYTLSNNEIAYAGVSANGHRVTEPYTLRTVNPNNSYTTKLFGYPVWIDDIVGYRLQWWMLNLDRNVYFDVTPFVVYSANTPSFMPQGYGRLQQISVSVNLSAVSGAFKPFIHTQLVAIALHGRPSDMKCPWEMSNEYLPSRPAFGRDLFIRSVDTEVINLASGFDVYTDWLQHMYYESFPLMNLQRELRPPTPTHVVVMYGGSYTEVPVGDWNHDITFQQAVPIHRTVTLRWIKRVSTGDLHLAVTALLVQY
jgi:hypothetical protein